MKSFITVVTTAIIALTSCSCSKSSRDIKKDLPGFWGENNQSGMEFNADESSWHMSLGVIGAHIRGTWEAEIGSNKFKFTGMSSGEGTISESGRSLDLKFDDGSSKSYHKVGDAHGGRLK